MVIDLAVISLIIREEHSIHCMPCSSQILSEMLPEIHTMEKCYFLKFIIHFQIISFSVLHCFSAGSECISSGGYQAYTNYHQH